MSTIPLRLLVPGRVYRYSWRGINQDEEQRKKLIPAEILPLEPLQIGHEFQNEGLFMYLEKDTQTYGLPAPLGYVNKIPPLGFKGETPEEYMRNSRHETMKAILPASSFIFSELDRPGPAAGAGAGPAVPAPPPPPPSKEEQAAAAKYKEDVKMAGGRKNRRHARTKRNRRRRRVTRKRV